MMLGKRIQRDGGDFDKFCADFDQRLKLAPYTHQRQMFAMQPVAFENRTQKLFEHLKATLFAPSTIQAPTTKMPESAQMARLEARLKEKQAQQELN